MVGVVHFSVGEEVQCLLGLVGEVEGWVGCLLGLVGEVEGWVGCLLGLVGEVEGWVGYLLGLVGSVGWGGGLVPSWAGWRG